MILHAGLIAVRLHGRWREALIRGAAGAGKSDLTLRALALGFRLVADDRTLVWSSAGALYGRAPEPLAGLIELRGVGVVSEPALPMAEVALVIDCGCEGEIERMPEPAAVELAGVMAPRLRLNALEASGPAKLGRALNRLGRGRGAA